MYESSAPTELDQSVIIDQVYFYALDEERPGVVLNPACDFAQDKAEFVMMCALHNAWDLIRGLLASDWKKIKNQKEAANQIKLMIRQRFPRYHWLPPLPGANPPLVADFQTLSTLHLAEVSELPKRAALRSPFREQLPTRFASYMNRIGVPDPAESDVNRWIDSGSNILFPGA